jgi:hypothetical protein
LLRSALLVSMRLTRVCRRRYLCCTVLILNMCMLCRRWIVCSEKYIWSQQQQKTFGKYGFRPRVFIPSARPCHGSDSYLPNSALSPGFGLWSVRERSVVDEVPLEQISDRVLQLSGVVIIPPVIDMYSLIYRGNCIILAATSLLNSALQFSHSWGCKSDEPLVKSYLEMVHYIQKYSVFSFFFRSVRKIAKMLSLVS